MIEVRRETLFPACVNRRRIGPANIATDDPSPRSQRLQSPNNVGHVKSAAFPVRYRLIRSQAVHVDGDIDRRIAGLPGEVLESFAPVLTTNRAATLLLTGGAIVRPRMNIQPAQSLCAAIPENLSRPPAFKITAAPNADSSQLRKIKRAIKPSAASPFRPANIPIRMVIERNEDEWLR